jgi:WD40 repeat protein
MYRSWWNALLAVAVTLAAAGRLPAQPEDPLPPGALVRFGDVRGRHDVAIYNSALAPDGKRLATVSERSVAVWDARSGRRWAYFPLPPGPQFVTPGLAFSPDSRYLGLTRGPRQGVVWDLHTTVPTWRLGRYGLDFRFDLPHCQFTADGQFLCWDYGRLGSHDLKDWRLTRSLAVHLHSLELLSPDARTYLSRGPESQAVLGDAVTGKERVRLDATLGSGLLRDLFVRGAFAPDGKTLALLHQDQELRLFDVANGKLLRALKWPAAVPDRTKSPHLYWPRVGFTEDGRTLFVATLTGPVLRWDAATGKPLPPLRGHAGQTVRVHAPADGKVLVSTGEDGMIRRWDALTGKELNEPPGYVGHTAAALSPGGLVALADARGRLDLWDTRGKLVRTLRRDGPAVTRLAFRPDGKVLAAVEPTQLRLWDAATGKELGLLAGGKTPWGALTGDVRFSPDGGSLAIPLTTKLQLLDAGTGKLRWEAGVPHTHFQAFFTPDGAALVVRGAGPELRYLDAATGKEKTRARLVPDNVPERNKVLLFTPTPDGHRLAALATAANLDESERDGDRLCLFAAAGGRELLAFTTWKDRPTPTPEADDVAPGSRWLAFSPDGLWLASRRSDGVIAIRDASTAHLLLSWDGTPGPLTAFAFTPDGRALFSCGADGQALLWSLRPEAPFDADANLWTLWTALASPDAVKVHQAVWALAERPGAAAYLRKQLEPVPKLTPARLQRLIADLNSAQFKVREAARRELTEAGDQARPALEALVQKPTSVEAATRARQILDARLRPTAEELRVNRAVLALELADTDAAREVLRAWAAGGPGARLTDAAAGSLKRWQLRQAAP